MRHNKQGEEKIRFGLNCVLFFNRFRGPALHGAFPSLSSKTAIQADARDLCIIAVALALRHDVRRDPAHNYGLTKVAVHLADFGLCHMIAANWAQADFPFFFLRPRACLSIEHSIYEGIPANTQ